MTPFLWIVLLVAVAIVVASVVVVSRRSSGGSTDANAVRRGNSEAEAQAYLSHVRRDTGGSY